MAWIWALLPTKRQKLNDDVVAPVDNASVPSQHQVVDPIKIVLDEPDLHDLIFQYLSGSDVKNLFTVSKSWNEAVSTSKTAMSKIKLVVNGIKLLSDTTLLLNSNRRYQNASFDFYSGIDIERKMLLLKRFSLSLVELSLSVDSRTSAKPPSELNFPKLKKLTVSTNLMDVATGFLEATTKQLEELQLIYEPMFAKDCLPVSAPPSSSFKILKLHKCNKKSFEYIIRELRSLKTLEVCAFEFDKIPHDSPDKNESITTLQLKYSSEIPRNVIRSMKNLQVIETSLCDKRAIVRILREGKNLKEIKIKYWNDRNDLQTFYNKLIRAHPSLPHGIKFEYKNDL